MNPLSRKGFGVIGLIEVIQILLPNPNPLDAFEGARVTRPAHRI
jgi:hypothetical protein